MTILVLANKLAMMSMAGNTMMKLILITFITMAWAKHLPGYQPKG